MATAFLSTGKPFLHSSSTPSSFSSLTYRPLLFSCPQQKSLRSHWQVEVISSANAAILEADDDEELMEKVKKDRKKRLERQGVISSANKEKGYLQDIVYKLSKVGQFIDNNDLSAASSVLGGSTDTDWVKKANIAFTKLSSSPEEKTQVDTFNSSLASLISSVTSNDIESSKDCLLYHQPPLLRNGQL
ncbi:THYLAKOID LUMENAL 16.5 KDA PROTEIN CHLOROPLASTIC [Salix purpurea]|uniref:THYLAKOID LUMENAL 16.5 kDa PROTEIN CHLOROPLASTIC n=1 Tax=Salix purpurea TaxID=77065 RepID=A0A9Q0ULB2_SALPP|nr:THYLAKOID LUMENAL 16.5 KDA PROTEIN CHLOROPLASTIC [Salix purpurea]